MKLSGNFRHHLNLFVYYLYNNTLIFAIRDSSLLKELDYLSEFEDMSPTNMEMLFAVFTNNINMDESGKVINAEYAFTRAAEFLRLICDEEYNVELPFEAWETDTHHYKP